MTSIRSCKAHHASVYEGIVYFCKKEASHGDALSHVICEGRDKVAKKIHGGSMKWLGFHGSVRWKRDMSLRLRKKGQKTSRMVCPKQKSVNLVQYLVDKFSKASELLDDLIFSTFPTAKACLDHPRYRHFVGCRVDSKYFVASTEVIAETYRRQVLH